MIALEHWQALSPTRDALRLRYSFGPGHANCLALELQPRKWLLVSPPLNPEPAALAELDTLGEVRWLLAPNAYHHLGQATFRSRYPEAQSYAAASALPRLSRVSTVAYHEHTALNAVTSRLHVVAPGGQKAPDLLLRFEASAGTVWWLGDLISNTRKQDSAWWLRFVAQLAGGGVGYRITRWPELVYVRDRNAWRSDVTSLLREHPPAIVVPAHGEPVLQHAATRTYELLNALST